MPRLSPLLIKLNVVVKSVHSLTGKVDFISKVKIYVILKKGRQLESVSGMFKNN